MKMVLIVLGLGVSVTLMAQKNKEVDLKWKVQDDEVISYKTIMHEMDTAKSNWEFNAFFQNDLEEKKESWKILKEMNEAFEEIELYTDLSLDKKGRIDVVMYMKDDEESPGEISDINDLPDSISSQNLHKLSSMMNQGVMLRGTLNESGGIESFWIKSSQKNLIAMLFELPETPVKVGDTWELEINFVANDQNFVCDTSSKINRVELVEVKKVKGEKIAVLEYEQMEYVKGIFQMPNFMPSMNEDKKDKETMMLFRYEAVAEFSIDRGRWISYDGITLLQTHGYMETFTQKKFALIPNN